MRNKIIGIFVCMLMIAGVVLPAAGTINEKVTRENKVSENQTSKEFVPGEFIVKLKKDTTLSSSTQFIALNEKHQVYAVERVFPNAQGTILDNIYLVHVPIGSDILAMVREYASCPNVVYAEPNGIGHACGIPNDTNFSRQWSVQNTELNGITYPSSLPNDPYFKKQWYLHCTGQIYWVQYLLFGKISIPLPVRVKPGTDIKAAQAWDITTGSPNVTIAIIDTGVDYTHPDLAANIWTNKGEIPGNGIDDDHNGYIDDVRGWNFAYKTNDPMDDYGHGTGCAGIADAVGNNGIGVTGVAWNCKIMPVKVLDSQGSGSEKWLVNGIKYAADNGANVISMSIGGFSNSTTLRDAINYAYSKGVFICAAAGNGASDTKNYPGAFDNVTTVGYTNYKDQVGQYSSYGDWVDIAAPGWNLYTTAPSQSYDPSFGLGSGATPQVAGAAALLLSKNPSLTPDEVKTLLCNNTDPYTGDHYIGKGRLDVYKALSALKESMAGVPID